MYEIVCEDHPAQRLLSRSASLSQAQVGAFLSEAFPALYATLKAFGADPAGPPQARYRVGADAFRVTAAIPFAGDVTPGAAEQIEQAEPCTVATTIHTGSYEGLPAAFHAVLEWAQVNGYTVSGDPWECYLDGPEVAQPRTKVCFPVVGS